MHLYNRWNVLFRLDKIWVCKGSLSLTNKAQTRSKAALTTAKHYSHIEYTMSIISPGRSLYRAACSTKMTYPYLVAELGCWLVNETRPWLFTPVTQWPSCTRAPQAIQTICFNRLGLVNTHWLLHFYLHCTRAFRFRFLIYLFWSQTPLGELFVVWR